MTEAEWLASPSPYDMIVALGDRVSPRKRRLYACGCCRRVWHFLPDEQLRQGVAAAERYADGFGTAGELLPYRGHAYLSFVKARGQAEGEAYGGPPAPNATEEFAAARMVYEAVEQSVEEVHKYITWDNLTRGRQPPVQVDVLRDLFADRFRPVVLRPGWLSPSVLALAAGVYDDHAFDRLPILADALEEAGCDNRDVLDHCRGPGPHARGCWVVDLVLGKG